MRKNSFSPFPSPVYFDGAINVSAMTGIEHDTIETRAVYKSANPTYITTLLDQQ